MYKLNRAIYQKNDFNSNVETNILNLRNFEFKNVKEVSNLFHFLEEHPEIDTLKTGYITLTNGNEMMDVKPKRLIAFTRHLAVNQTLTTLDLCGNNLGDDNIRLLSFATAKNKTIKHLGLASTFMGYRGFESLMKILVCHPSIESLDIGGNLFQGHSHYYLYGDYFVDLLTKNTVLKTLTVDYDAFFGFDRQEWSLERLADAFAKNHTLQHLFLDEVNHYTPDPQKVFELLKKNRSIISIGGVSDPILDQYLQDNNLYCSHPQQTLLSTMGLFSCNKPLSQDKITTLEAQPH